MGVVKGLVSLGVAERILEGWREKCGEVDGLKLEIGEIKEVGERVAVRELREKEVELGEGRKRVGELELEVGRHLKTLEQLTAKNVMLQLEISASADAKITSENRASGLQEKLNVLDANFETVKLQNTELLSASALANQTLKNELADTSISLIKALAELTLSQTSKTNLESDKAALQNIITKGKEANKALKSKIETLETLNSTLKNNLNSTLESLALATHPNTPLQGQGTPLATADS